MSRKIPEWVGSNDNAKIPIRVRLRIFEREHGICWLSKRKIMPGELWDIHHGKALINGGEHAENNLFPVLQKPHREQTKLDVAEKAKVARKRKNFLGIKKPSRFPGSKTSGWKKRLDGTVVKR